MADLSFTPMLMPAPAAAHYIGVSETTLRGLGIPRRILGGKRLYHRFDLDAFANDLAIDGAAEVNTCEGVFGAANS